MEAAGVVTVDKEKSSIQVQLRISHHHENVYHLSGISTLMGALNPSFVF